MFKQINKFRKFFGDLRRSLTEGIRFYQVDDLASYPSITSVISFVNRKKWADWTQKVGLEEANRIKEQSSGRGTKFHKVMEVYIENGDYESLEEYQVPLIQLMFKAAKPHVDRRLNNIYHQETKMYSHKFGLAGTVDLICEVDGELAVVDFKTSKQEKPEEWLEDYFVQLAAYWAMFSEKTGVAPKKLVVFLVGENGDVQIVERRNIMDYLETLQDYASQFIQHYDAQLKRY